MPEKKLELGGRFDVFVFDWDGTLNNLKWIRAVNEKINPNWWYKKRKSASMSGKTSRAAYGIDNELLSDIKRLILTPLVDLYLFFDKPKLQRGAMEALDALRKKKKMMAIFTNGAKYRVERELEELGITDYFFVVLSAQDLKVLKPNPAGLEKIVKILKAENKTILYSGDMVDDIEMAKRYSKEIANAHVRSCGVANGLDSYDNLKAADPDYLFKNMQEFGNAI